MERGIFAVEAETVAAANGVEFVAITDYNITLDESVVSPGQTLLAHCDREISMLDKVYVNRKLLDDTCYTLTSDVVVLTADYLATLSESSYELFLWHTLFPENYPL